MTPPQRLRRELERQRDRGRAFRIAWPVAVSTALAGLPLRQQVFWRSTFTEQRGVWHACYSGPNRSKQLSRSDAMEEPSSRSDVTLVA